MPSEFSLIGHLLVQRRSLCRSPQVPDVRLRMAIGAQALTGKMPTLTRIAHSSHGYRSRAAECCLLLRAYEQACPASVDTAYGPKAYEAEPYMAETWSRPVRNSDG